MDKPFKQITSLKSTEDLRQYLQSHRNLNLCLMVDKNNATLLHYAAFKNDLTKMRIYFQHYKAYCQVTHGNKMYEAGFQSKVKAWINTSNAQGLTPLHFASLNGNIEITRLLQQLGGNMQFHTKQNQNVLFMAVQNNEIKTLIYLLEQSRNKLDITQRNHIGDNLLHKAARNGCVGICAYLLTTQIDPNQQNNQGFTPLMQATLANSKQIVKNLLLKGVDRHLKNNDQKQALDIAQEENRTQLVNILNDQFTFVQKIKIACNVKIVYAVEKQSYMYAFFFVLLFHVVLAPTCIITQFSSVPEDKIYFPIIIEGLYYLITMALFILLLRKHKKKKPLQSLMSIELPFCAQCRNQKKNQYHCFICSKCIHRYDHHCPWINNCIGIDNIGKFYVFLWLLEMGSVFVILCHLCMLGLDKNIVRYRQFTGIEAQQIATSVICLLIAIFFAFSIFLLIIQQTKNLTSNSTQFERSKNARIKAKQSQTSQNQTLLSEQKLPSQSFLEHSQTEQPEIGCLGNCRKMLCHPSD